MAAKNCCLCRTHCSDFVRLMAILLLVTTDVCVVLSQERSYEVHKKTFPASIVEVVEVRNLQAEDFLDKLEIEIKNVSQKPIYYLLFSLKFPDVSVGSGFYSIPIRYGRIELAKRGKLPQSEDVPIKPGKSCVLKVPHVEGMKKYLSRANIPDSATKRMEIVFRDINFGDGTGIVDGRFYAVKPVD